MDPNTLKLLMGSAGAGAVADKLYIEDVFSTYLYTGTGASQTITNGIDLTGKGGLVWIKNRSGADFNLLDDTARGAGKFLWSNASDAQQSYGLSSFSSSGFSTGSTNDQNRNLNNFVSWTFRKAAKFFDVVTYTGNGAATKSVSHALGSTPGCVIIKKTSATGEWCVFHKFNNAGDIGTNDICFLNRTNAFENFASVFESTSSSFIVPNTASSNSGVGMALNDNGATYVAYLFAHDAGGFGDSGNDNVISCGSYTGNGSTSGPTVTLGWEPQWLLIKRSDSTGDWNLIDNLRGFVVGGADAELNPNLSNAESSGTFVSPLATGFQLNTTDAGYNASGGTYIYIAIRRGPMKTPTAGTDVFYAELEPQTDLRQSEGVPFPPDLVNTFSRNGTDRTSGYDLFTFVDRLRGLGTPNNTFGGSSPYLISSSTGAENSINQSFVQLKADGRNITSGAGWNSSSYGNFIYYFFRRAPGFFDVVALTGIGGTQNYSHNLKAVPELIISRRRDFDGADWWVYAAPLGVDNLFNLNNNLAIQSGTGLFGSSAPTSSQFSLLTAGGALIINYIFATCPGVSKVGSYTGTGTTQQINCGFTNGARFVLIKRTDDIGDWYVWDTARGIVSGNDPFLLLNSTAAENTSTDYIDPLSTGFEISSTAPAAINANGGSYIYLAIA